MGTPQQHSISEAQAAMRSGKLSSVELVRRCLDRHRRYNGALNATLCLVRGALDQAAQCDADARRGRFQGRLHGIPLVVKDNIDVKGMPTTVASALFAQASPCVRDARAVEKLRGEGAIILAKTNMDEFAAHVSGRTSHWGPSVNPWRMEEGFSPGGSSSGTAAAVAAGFCWGGLGTDTGGSVRLPAAWCGLCGLRPTYGSVSLDGVYPRASSLDTVGALAGSVRDVSLLMEIAAEAPFPGTKAGTRGNGLRIAVLAGDMEDAPHAVREACALSIRRWNELGTCVWSSFPLLEDPDVTSTVDLLRSYEFARDVRRDMEAHREAEHTVHAEVLVDYRKGQSVPTLEYEEALRCKREFMNAVEAFFVNAGVDFLLLPAARCAAPRLDAPAEEFGRARSLVNLFSITENPSLVLPGAQADGMPFGLQLVGPRGSDGPLLRAGMAYEAAYGPFPMPLEAY